MRVTNQVPHRVRCRVIDAIIADDKQRPRKRRHTAKRIFERLPAEHSFTGGYTIVKDYVRESKVGSQEMFVPLAHAPGEAQADFGEAQVVIAGVEQTAYYQAFDLPTPMTVHPSFSGRDYSPHQTPAHRRGR